MTTSTTRTEHVDEEAALAGVVAAESLRAVELGAAVLLGLLICPPLAILAVVVVVPLLMIALVLGLIVAVLGAPYLLVHHFRTGHPDHLSLLADRLRRTARSVADLAPHRIVADARRLRA